MRRLLAAFVAVPLAASCGGAPTTPAELTECPPAGVELQDCVYPNTVLDEARPGYHQTLRELCESPCRAIENLTLRNLQRQSLTELKAIAHFERVVNTLEMSNNPEIQDLRGLESIKEVFRLTINNYHPSAKLQSLRGLDNLLKVEHIEVSGGASMKELGAFSQFTVIPGTLSISGSNLVDISSLSNLEEAYRLMISSTGLTDLSALKSFRKAGGQFYIAQNKKLVSLGAFSALESAGGFTVHDNPLLPQCEAEALAARIQARKPEIIGNNTAATCDAN